MTRKRRLLAPLATLALAFACGPSDASSPSPSAPPSAAPSAAPDRPLGSSATAPAKMIGYDLRRLRPRDDETLAAMFERLHIQAKADGKRTAVLFSADWCAPCKKIEAELGNLQPAEQIEDVRIFELKEEDWTEVTRMSEFNELRARWYPKKGSYPVLVLLDAEGAALEEMKEAIDRLEGEGLEPTLPNWFATTRKA